ncbi:DUF4270 family protein [Thermophagus sp. OGC60D27]|uniref:DUF4270 family protein n=1 Tax=Thermophagus sp. OGC60D27 TaxID=3458415 RepID=UPI004037ACF2
MMQQIRLIDKDIQPFLSIILLLTLVPLTPSCSEGDLSIGDGFVTTDTYTAIVDTFSLQLSTIKMDSVETSSTGVAITGYTSDEYSATKAASFFQVINDANSINDKEQFDSICLILSHNGFYRGDTSSLFTINVHRLEEEIETNDSWTLCNYDSFKYSETPLATYRYTPEPNDERTISIRLDDELGKTLMDTLQNDVNLTTSEFTDWFKGLALIPDTTSNNLILGFEAGTDSIYLRLYTHRIDLEKVENHFDFPLSETSLQFNHIKSYPVNSALENLDSYKKKLKTQNLNNTAIQEAGTGYFTRIDIPGISSMKALQQKGRIVKANLTIGIDAATFEYQEPPETIYLLEADKINQVAGYVINSSDYSVTGTLTTSSALYERDWYYTFDITYFLNALVDEEITSDGTGILIAYSEEDLQGSCYKMLFDGYDSAESKTRLNVFYYYYDIEDE